MRGRPAGGKACRVVKQRRGPHLKVDNINCPALTCPPPVPSSLFQPLTQIQASTYISDRDKAVLGEQSYSTAVA